MKTRVFALIVAMGFFFLGATSAYGVESENLGDPYPSSDYLTTELEALVEELLEAGYEDMVLEVLQDPTLSTEEQLEILLAEGDDYEMMVAYICGKGGKCY